MSWHKTAAMVTLMLAPMLMAGTDAVAGQIITSSSSGDAAWLATQLHQMHFANRAEQAFDSSSYDGVDASSIGDGPHTNGFHSSGSGGASRVLPVAERYRGTNPTRLSIPWCAVFANMVLARTGFSGTGSAAARSFAQYGRPASGPAPGVIAVWPHHVGFVIGSAGPGRIRVVSGNHNHRVDESIYATRGVLAFRYPVRSRG
jgi:uncharacterized protein (TIGR02594 family)